MDSHLKYLLKKYNLHLQYGSSHEKGCIVKTPDGFPDLLMVKEGLSDEETEKVILHEIGHAKNDDYSHRDYKYSYVTRLVCEDGADDFVIKERIRQFIALNNEPVDANYINLAQSIGTTDYMKVKSELSKYIPKKK